MSSVEDRLTALESELTQLRRRLESDSNWIAHVSGSLKEFPEFEDVLRLGREARQRDDQATDDDNGNGR